MSRFSCRTESFSQGMILVDILVALSLAVLFVAAIAESSLSAREIFNMAHEKERLLDIYELHATEFDDLLPYQSRTIVISDSIYLSTSITAISTTTITAHARWYGNERIETDVTVGGSLTFVRLRLATSSQSAVVASTPLCSVDFSSSDIIGSYSYLRNVLAIEGKSNTASTSNLVTASIKPITLPIDPSLPLTDLEIRNGIAYISADSSTVSDPDLLIVDIRNLSSPIFRSALNTGPGIASFTLVGKNIFAAAASTAAQLHIIGMNSLDSLTLLKKYQLPLPYATATPPMASSISYDNNRVYLGTDKWDGEEFSIIDVSNPANPSRLGSLETGSKVNDILLQKTIAYIAASDQNQLRAVDTDNPAHPLLINTFSPSGWERQEGKTLDFFEDILGFGRTSGGFDISGDHELFAWGSTTMAALSQPVSVNVPGGIYGVVTDRSHIYVITRQTGRELQIFDRQASSTAPNSFNLAQTHSLPVSPQTLTCDGSKLYVLAHSAPVIYEISF